MDKTGWLTHYLHTTQYAVTEFSHIIDLDKPDSIPGIFVQFDIEPINLQITAKKLGTVQFITRLCGVFGGMFVVVGIVLNITQTFTRFFHQKLFSNKKEF